jgi:hypothetical protein
MKRNLFNASNKIKITLYIIISFIILTCVELVFFMPKVKNAIKDSDAIELINQAKTKKQQSDFNIYTLFFVSMNNNIISYNYKGNKRVDFLHDSFEYQLKSPPMTALEKYCVTFIPENTKLIGVTSSEKATYLNVSKELLNSLNFSLCYEQLEAQALSINRDGKFFLLIDGNLYNKDKVLIKEFS